MSNSNKHDRELLDKSAFTNPIVDVCSIIFK